MVNAMTELKLAAKPNLSLYSSWPSAFVHRWQGELETKGD
jgi:hypothetical protein